MATGDYYCKLAEHLYMSYKLFSGCDYPFYVVTDEPGKNRLSKLFDGVIVRNDFTFTPVDKVYIFENSPFDEMVFIDADCSVVNDLNYVFDLFEQNGSDISAISKVAELKEGENGVQFTANTAKTLGFNRDFPRFNGGVYWYKKSQKSSDAFRFLIDELLPNYHKYELKKYDYGKYDMADEPLVIVTMLKFGFDTLPVESNIMFLLYEKTLKVKWDMKKHICFYPWDDKIVSPSIIHWKFGGTETLMYEKYDAEVRGKYYNQSRFTVWKAKTLSLVKYKIYPKLLKVFPRLHKTAAKSRD